MMCSKKEAKAAMRTAAQKVFRDLCIEDGTPAESAERRMFALGATVDEAINQFDSAIDWEKLCTTLSAEDIGAMVADTLGPQVRAMVGGVRPS